MTPLDGAQAKWYFYRKKVVFTTFRFPSLQSVRFPGTCIPVMFHHWPHRARYGTRARPEGLVCGSCFTRTLICASNLLAGMLAATVSTTTVVVGVAMVVGAGLVDAGRSDCVPG